MRRSENITTDVVSFIMHKLERLCYHAIHGGGKNQWGIVMVSAARFSALSVFMADEMPGRARVRFTQLGVK